jgi:DnaK suppressor protein
MNEDQLAFFKQRLLEQKQELLDNVRDTSEHLRETEATSDVSDRATQEEEQALELRTRDRERKLLKKIEEALGRIEDGSYGFCAETGEPIGVRRLLARPTATLSIEAQERRERLQRMYGD